jgi:hypothetical protein
VTDVNQPVKQAIQHPLVDRVGENWVETRTNAMRVGLTEARVALIKQAAREGSRVLVIAPAGARITFPLIAMLRRTSGDWATELDGQYFSPGRGFTTADTADIFRRWAPPPVTPALTIGTLDPASAVGSAVQLTVSVHHRAAAETRIGRSLEIIARAITASAPEAWGVHEPVTVDWDRDRLTAFARSHAPGDVLVYAAGAGFSATIRVARSATGVIEETRFFAPLDTGSGAARQSLTTALTTVANDQRALIGIASETFGTADVAIPPLYLDQPAPLAALLGARVSRDLGSRLDAVDGVAAITRVGRPRSASAVISFEGRGSDALHNFARAGSAIGVDAITELTTLNRRV